MVITINKHLALKSKQQLLLMVDLEHNQLKPYVILLLMFLHQVIELLEDKIIMLFLQSQCGYLTTNTWGEYEEANDAGAYDSIMMNMVYYTGLKSFVNYPFTTVGEITNLAEYQGTIGSTKGFYGSHMVKIVNKKRRR